MASMLQIDTIKGLQEDFSDDEAPFLLSMVQGAEGISMPFAYDLTLYRSESLAEANVADFINTRVAIGIKNDDTWIRRRGMIATMGKTGVTNIRHRSQTNFFTYTARVVPAFRMLENEVTFRVFEATKFSAIFKQIIHGFPGVPGDSYVDFSQLTADEDPVIDYCVQFGESSYNFLSRLMAQYGIWYMFEHRHSRELAENETMVLGRSLSLLQQCAKDQMKIVLYDPDDDAIAQFSRAYVPSHHHVWVADFNEDNPTQPPSEPPKGGDRDVFPAYDLQPSEPSATSRFSAEQFPYNQDAETLMRSEEAGVFTAQGQTENKTFFAGRTFQVTEDQTGAAGQDKNYLITALAFTAFQQYGHSVGWNLLNMLSNLTWKQFLPGDKRFFNIFGNLSGQALSNYLQNEGPYAIGAAFKLGGNRGNPPQPYNGGATKPFFLNFAAGGLIALAGASEAQSLFDSIDDLIKGNESKFACTFTALPHVAKAGAWRFPLPVAHQATVNGVHLAVVIGAKGTDQSQLGQTYTNSDGKVRIRFGWQRTLPATAPSTDPLKTDACAAWVRVSEGWAGRQYGTQFLPRIGDEVVVSFIDGDPNRPIITGRVYNGYAHQPFDPTAEATRSGIKTQTTPKDYNSAQKFNLVRFDDAVDKEQLLLRAQGRQDFTALNSAYQTVYGNYNLLVKQNPQGQPPGSNVLVEADGGYALTVGGDRSEDVGGDYNLTVKGDVQEDLQGDASAVVAGDFKVNATNIVMEAMEKITLKVGGCFVVVSAASIAINAPLVNINAGGSPDSTENLTMKDAAAPAMADPGTPADWLAKNTQGGGGGGQDGGTHTAVAQHAPTFDGDGEQITHVGGQQIDDNPIID